MSAPRVVIDVLPTGERQPRLPAPVGAVREVELPHPPIAALPARGARPAAPVAPRARQPILWKGGR